MLYVCETDLVHGIISLTKFSGSAYKSLKINLHFPTKDVYAEQLFI